MLHRAGSSGRNHRYGNIFCNCSGQFQIVTCFCSIAVHTGQKNFSCTQFIHFHCPFYRIDTDIDPAAVFVDIPTTSVFSSSCINRYNHTLAAKFICRLTDQLRCIDRRRIDGNLVCPFTQKHLKIFYGSDASADGKWNKYFLSYFSYHINNRISGIRRGCDIQKYQFIGSGLIISCRNLHRIPGIPQIHKIHTFYHAAVMNIQTWNDSFRKHIRFPPFRSLRNSAGSAVRHHCSSPDGTDMQKYFPFLPMHGSWCCTR